MRKGKCCLRHFIWQCINMLPGFHDWAREDKYKRNVMIHSYEVNRCKLLYESPMAYKTRRNSRRNCLTEKHTVVATVLFVCIRLHEQPVRCGGGDGGTMFLLFSSCIHFIKIIVNRSWYLCGNKTNLPNASNFF